MSQKHKAIAGGGGKITGYTDLHRLKMNNIRLSVWVGVIGNEEDSRDSDAGKRLFFSYFL